MYEFVFKRVSNRILLQKLRGLLLTSCPSLKTPIIKHLKDDGTLTFNKYLVNSTHTCALHSNQVGTGVSFNTKVVR